MPISIRSSFVALAVLLLAPLLAAAQIRCGAPLSAIEKLICADEGLIQLDAQLGDVYGVLRGVTTHKKELAREQTQWLTSSRDSCESRDCVAKAYLARMEVLSSQLLSQAKVRADPLSSGAAMNACTELSALADDRRLSKYAWWGRAQWDAKPGEGKTAWTLSAAELEKLKLRDSYQTSSGPHLVYRIRIKNGDEPTRFASFQTGGTCASTQVLNVSHLLDSTGEDVGVDQVPDPKEEIRWTYWGGGDYPVLYKGRNFMITSALGDPNSVNMISWIKPDGRIRPLCMLAATERKRVPLPTHKAPLCQAVASGSLSPLRWKPITDDLPFNHEPAVYRNEFERRYGQYADSVGLLQVDLNGDGVTDPVARFEYNSGAGCGSTRVWMSVVSKDLGSVAHDPLNKLLEGVYNGSMDLYEYKGRHYVNTSVARGNDVLVSLQGNRVEPVCEFEWKSKSVVSKFFEVEP